MATEQVEKYIHSIQSSIDEILSSVDGLSEETIRWNPTEDEWSIVQILNHVNEATPYWLSEMETVLEKPGSEWGRGLTSPDRLAAVDELNGLNIKEVIKATEGLKTEVSQRLSKVDDAQLKEENPHRNFKKFGNKPVSFLIEHFIVEHTEGHSNQIKRNLSKLPNASK
ncbi:DinB family protein [Oceanobacillus sp. CF4.6]|uniref:DinB family protein n=1 Tax=Oceanobacillus sp. CF4.6 TaxID=3373080 RepID=UPI003EE5A3B1